MECRSSGGKTYALRYRDKHNRQCQYKIGNYGDLSFEKAGPRERLYFDPAATSAAFVTCGGLAPGLNNTIRSGFLELRHNYGVERILGIREGYRGLDPHEGLEPIELTPASVDDINDLGGTVIGTSRGGRDAVDMVDYLETLQAPPD